MVLESHLMGPAGQLESSESRKLFHGASVITTFNGLLWKVSPKVSPDPMSQLRNRKRSLVTARRDTQADLLAEHHEDKKYLAAMKGPATEVMQMTSRSCVGTGHGTGRLLMSLDWKQRRRLRGRQVGLEEHDIGVFAIAHLSVVCSSLSGTNLV